MHYYTYAYLREDKTPYYIGKGKGDRIYIKRKGEIKPPKDSSRIIFLKKNLTEEQAFRHEIYMIDVLGRKDLGTGILRNRSDGGEGPSGIIRSKEYRRKMSDSKKNPSEETRKKMSESGKVKIFSEEHRRNISDAMIGKTCSEETRRNMSDRMKGENNPIYGKTRSEETKRKIGDANKGTKWWNDGCGNRKRMIECPGDGWKPGRK
jgi:hypothetical protein